MASSASPDWATQIMAYIKSIKVSVSKIDGIEKLVNQINSKVENLETKNEIHGYTSPRCRKI